MIKEIIEIKEPIRKLVKINITKDDIIKLLEDRGEKVPEHVDVIFHVPSGGDYSGIDLDVNFENPITVIFKQ